jgi:ABC-type lipoprotein release transport system permease subunit
MALGASPGRLATAVLRDSLRVVAIGSVAGVVLAVWAGRIIRERLYGLGPYDAKTLIVCVAVLAAVALVASWAPARRASRVDPVDALRE